MTILQHATKMALQSRNLWLSHIDIKIAILFLTVIVVSGLMLCLKAKEP